MTAPTTPTTAPTTALLNPPPLSILRAAGYHTKANHVLDGSRLNHVLFDGKRTKEDHHQVMFHPDGNGDLSAMRFGELKLFFRTYGAAGCGATSTRGSFPVIEHNPPIIFNLTSDPGETTPCPACLNATTLAHVLGIRDTKIAEIAADRFVSTASYSLGDKSTWACCNQNHTSCECNLKALDHHQHWWDTWV